MRFVDLQSLDVLSKIKSQRLVMWNSDYLSRWRKRPELPKHFTVTESQLVYLFFPMLLTPNEGKYWTPRARAAVRRNVNEKLGQHGFVWLSVS